MILSEAPRRRGVLGSQGLPLLLHKFLLDALPDLISHSSKDRKSPLLRSLGSRGVFEGPVQPVGGSWEERAGFVGLVTDGYHVVEGFSQISLQGLRLLARDVYADLVHDLHRLRSNVSRFRPSAHNLEAALGEIAQHPLRHL